VVAEAVEGVPQLTAAGAFALLGLGVLAAVIGASLESGRDFAFRSPLGRVLRWGGLVSALAGVAGVIAWQSGRL
jgi:hypothetical protein